MVRNISKVFIQSTAERVWQTITDPQFVKQWQYNSDLTTIWEVGKEIRFKTVWNDQIFEQWGTVLEYDVEKKIRYSLFAPRADLVDKPENYFTMIYELIPHKNGIQLVITQEDNRPGAIQEEEQGGENPILSTLKDLAEKRK